MLVEAREAPARVAARLSNAGDIGALAKALRQRDPTFALTVARGSSDHAANFVRYALETELGLVTASAAPSVVTSYAAKLHTAEAFALAISQSGQSPDILAVMRQCQEAGAITAAMVNAAGSPLEGVSGHVIPIGAGPETSVAATKSFIGTLALTARLVAEWRPDPALQAALAALPDRLAAAAEMDWSAALDPLAEAANTLVVARGRTYPVAQEAALKLKEVCALHAEPFSTAEVQHGPMSLIDQGFPLLVLAVRDATFSGVITLAETLRKKGAHILLAASDAADLAPVDTPLELPPALHPILDPIIAIQAFYPLAAALAHARGHDPDTPRHLRKVTKTR